MTPPDRTEIERDPHVARDPRPDDAPHPAPSGAGALPGTAGIVGAVIAEAAHSGDGVTVVAQRLDEAMAALVNAIGGGPPAEIEACRGTNRAAVQGLAEASADLREAARALQAFVRTRT
jgi:hypothetical protein